MTSSRRVQSGRLVYYRQKATADFWDEHWQESDIDLLYKYAQDGIAAPENIQNLYKTYLPKTAKTLEAGCGIAQVVIALRNLGYDVEGVDYAAKTIEQVKQRFPDLPVSVGDVTALNVPDNYYGAYISLGVIEHREAGPEPFLKEAWRILRPNGIALISVPHFHSLRRIKANLGLYRGQTDGMEFYQYAFQEAELKSYLTQAGFEWLGAEYYDAFKGLKDEIASLESLINIPYLGKRLRHRLQHSAWLRRNFGHMIMAICRKPEN